MKPSHDLGYEGEVMIARRARPTYAFAGVMSAGLSIAGFLAGAALIAILVIS